MDCDHRCKKDEEEIVELFYATGGFTALVEDLEDASFDVALHGHNKQDCKCEYNIVETFTATYALSNLHFVPNSKLSR